MNFDEFVQQECPELMPAGQPQKSLMSEIPEWQHQFCVAHSEFMGTEALCPFSLDDCLISKIIDCGGSLDKLRGVEIGQGVTTDQVIEVWLGSGEPEREFFKNPAWILCLAEMVLNHKKTMGHKKLMAD